MLASLIRGVQRQAGLFDPGFSVDGITMAQFELPEGVYDRPRATAFFEEVAEAVRRLPVESTAFASHEPFSRYRHGTIFYLSGESRQQARQILFLNVSVEYLPLLAVPLRSGRYFEPADTARPVVIINETMAKRYRPGENPIGKTFFIRPRGPVDTRSSREIVGMVADVRTTPRRPFSRCSTSRSSPAMMCSATSAAIRGRVRRRASDENRRGRVDGDSADRRGSRCASAGSHDFAIRHGGQHADGPPVGPILAALLGAFALGLTTVGVFGVFAYAVRQQRCEIGIRMALGATPAAVVRLVLASHMRALAIGVVIGVLGSIAASAVLRNRLHGLSPFDLLAYGMAAVLLVSCGLAATLSRCVARRTRIRWKHSATFEHHVLNIRTRERLVRYSLALPRFPRTGRIDELAFSLPTYHARSSNCGHDTRRHAPSVPAHGRRDDDG